MHKLLIMIGALALPFAAPPAYADGHTEATPEIANKDWLTIVYLDFEQGQTDKALEMIKPFLATDVEMGDPPPMIVRLNSGPYDIMVMHPMREGIAAMGWKSDPRDEKWNAALAQRLGGEDAVKAHFEEFYDLVESRNVVIAHVDKDYSSDM